MRFRVGVDIGGTFTDFFVFDEITRVTHALKVPSQPDNPGAEVIDGLLRLQQQRDVEPQAISYFSHGTTVGVNTVIQRTGIRLCHFTTHGFVDILELARLRTPDVYNLLSRRPDPLIPRERVLSVGGRILGDGSEAEPVDRESVVQAVARARDLDVEGIVVSLINAYRNPAHEREVARIIRDVAPELRVYCSCEVWPIIREYERTISTVLHAYVQPRISAYLTSLEEQLRNAGVCVQPLVTKSNGGVMSTQQAKAECAQVIMSGTASGVIGAGHVASIAGFPDAISLDIGGTSADVAFVSGGSPRYGTGEMIGEFPLFIPSVSVTSIGAGGGSIARVDDLDILRVGPASAGAEPGPACYGKGGTEPTVTDAFAVLGYIGHRELGFNTVRVDVDAARHAVATVAERSGISSVEEAATAILRIAVSGMYLELSKLMATHGIDPRNTALFAFGGAGPMFACLLARELNITTIVVPEAPGVLSALGGLIGDLKNDFIRTVYLDLDSDSVVQMADVFACMQKQGETWLRDEQGYRGPITFLHSADMRYRGQSFEIETQLDPTAVSTGNVDEISRSFHETHQQVYAHADYDAPVQVINLRLVAVGQTPKPEFECRPANPVAATTDRYEPVYTHGSWNDSAHFIRSHLSSGHCFNGPAIVSQDDTTVCVPDGFDARVDPYGNLILRMETDTKV